MNIEIHSMDLSRMAKVLAGFADKRSQKNSNVEIIHEDNLLKMRATNSIQHCEMNTPLLGGNGEKVCVDAQMLASVAGNQGSRMVTIEAEGNVCIVKGNGRTRMTAVNVDLPKPGAVEGSVVAVGVEDLKRAIDNVAYAVCTNEQRIELTGIHLKSDGTELVLTALDGFQLSREIIPCIGAEVEGIAPVNILKTICAAAGGDKVQLQIGPGRMKAFADGVTIIGTLVAGAWPDVERIIPKKFGCEAKFKAAEMLDAIRASTVVDSKQMAIRFSVAEDVIHMSAQGEAADFDAEVPCEMNGEPVEIAFASNYLQNMLKAIGSEEAVMRFSSAVGPAIMSGKGSDGMRLTLPVRIR